MAKTKLVKEASIVAVSSITNEPLIYNGKPLKIA